MEIDREEFIAQFKKLEVAHGTTKTLKVAEAWYYEFGDCQREAFEKTMQALKFGEKFPTWRMFKEQYRIFEDKEAWIIENTCNGCLGGRVYWVYLKPDYGAVSYCDPCKICHPKMEGAVDPNEKALLDYDCKLFPDARAKTQAKVKEFENSLYSKKHGKEAPSLGWDKRSKVVIPPADETKRTQSIKKADERPYADGIIPF